MQQKQALLKQQLEFLSSAPFGDSPLFRMGLKVCMNVHTYVRTYVRMYIRIASDYQWLAQQVCTYLLYVAAVSGICDRYQRSVVSRVYIFLDAATGLRMCPH